MGLEMAIHGGPTGAEVGLADTNREFQLETRILEITVVFGQKCIFAKKVRLSVSFFLDNCN